MIDVRDMHRQAMEKADQAVAAQKAGDLKEARALFREACRLESEAAHALIHKPDAEPTRSVLFRSAASLAVEAQQFGYAAYLVASGLEGSPLQEIREELVALLRTVRREIEQDRVGRFLSSCAYLQAAADRVRTALADSGLMGRELSGFLTRKVLDSTQDSLRTFTGDTSLSIDLFSVGDGEVAGWIPVPPVGRLSEWWFHFAKALVQDHEDTLFQGNAIVGQIDELAREGALSPECVTVAQEAGIHALAAYPVRAVNENQADRPAFVLLALASQETAFADQLACHILSEAVSLLEIVIQIGWREEIFGLRNRTDEGTS